MPLTLRWSAVLLLRVSNVPWLAGTVVRSVESLTVESLRPTTFAAAAVKS